MKNVETRNFETNFNGVSKTGAEGAIDCVNLKQHPSPAGRRLRFVRLRHLLIERHGRGHHLRSSGVLSGECFSPGNALSVLLALIKSLSCHRMWGVQ